jgi:hypothetical protein
MEIKDIITIIFGVMGVTLLLTSYLRKHKEYHDNLLLMLGKCNAIKLSIKYLIIYILISLLFAFREPNPIMYLVVHGFFFLFFGLRTIFAKEQEVNLDYPAYNLESNSQNTTKSDIALLSVKLEHLTAHTTRFPSLAKDEINHYITQFTERFNLTFSNENQKSRDIYRQTPPKNHTKGNNSQDDISREITEIENIGNPENTNSSISEEIDTLLSKNEKKISDGIYALERTLALMQQTFTPDADVIGHKISRLNSLLDERAEILKNA